MEIGPYELLEPLGRGGMGIVYRGRHRQTGQVVAVKVMTAEMAAEPLLLKRFEQECSAARRLRHPHIVEGLDFGVHESQPYLVMELVDGLNLSQHIKQHGPLAQAEAVRIFCQVADALQLAHSHQLIHRDVKPENILLTKDGQAKLTDLGLLKDLAAGANLTRTRTSLGTLAFMAPEQFGDAKNADVRCDIYGLGASLYYALTKLVPFPGPGNLTILRKKLQSDFVPPRSLVADLNPCVDRAICSALDAAPSRRPRSCEEFAAMLTGARSAVDLDKCGPAEASGARQPVAAPPQPEERRVAERYASALGASCWPLQSGPHRWDAEIQDVSLTGLRLELERRFEAGAVLTVAVAGEQLNTVASWLVRVRWVREGTAKKWSMGCAFNRALCEDELNTLLLNKHSTIVIQAPE